MNASIISLYKKALRICGRKISFLFIISIPLGLFSGLVEIFFSLSLALFLISLGLAPSIAIPKWFYATSFMGPAGTFVFLGFLKILLTFLSALVTNISYEGFNVVIRRKASEFALLQNKLETRFSVSEMSSFFSNLLPRSSTFISSSLQISTGLLSLLVTFLGLLLLSCKLTFLAVILLLILGLPVFLTRKIFQRYSAQVYAKTLDFTKRLIKDLRNIYFLKIIGRTQQELNELVKINREIRNNYLRYIFGISLNSTFPYLVIICLIVLLLKVNQNFNLLAGAVLVPFLYLLAQSADNIGRIFTAFGNWQFNKPYFQSLVLFFQQDKETLKKDQALPSQRIKIGKFADLKTVDLDVGRESVLISGLNISASKGDFIYITGDSGKGKTTLLMTIIGLIPALDGKIYWNNTPVEDIDDGDLKSRVSYSGSDPFLLDSSLRENLLIGNEHLKLSDAQIWQALDLAGCGFVRGFPGKLEQKLQEGGEGISAGQKQRISIARALLRKPQILLLDEATANIDIETEQLILKNIRKYLPDTLVLAVSHRGSVAGFATAKISI